MNERIKKLASQCYELTKPDLNERFNKEKFAELIVRECIECCNEVAADADAMKDSKFVTDAGRMLHEGMWGGATNSIVTIKNRFGVE